MKRSQIQRFTALGGGAVAAVLGAVGPAAWGAPPELSQQELLAKIEQLEQKVSTLEQKQVSAADVDATLERVLADADQRSKLLQNDGSFLAGYDKDAQKFVLRNADGSFSFSPQVHFQFRNITNWRDNAKSQGGDDFENGFELRRTRLELEGTLFSPQLSYFIQFTANRNTGNVALDDAWVRYMFAEQWGFRLGQFKDPFSHEELNSDKRGLSVDRSLLNSLLHPGGDSTRVQGATLIYGGYNKDNPLNAEFGVTDGAGSFNTNFLDDVTGTDTTTDSRPDFGFAGRAEYKVFGDWKGYRDFSARDNKSDLLVLGAGGDFTGFNGGNQYSAVVDAQWENTAGLGVYAGALGRYFDPTGGGDGVFDYGGVAQVGYLLSKKWEVFARGDVTFFEDDTPAGLDEDTYPEFTLGFNYFLGPDGSWGHRAKFTVDVSWLPNGVPGDLTGIGYLSSPGEDEIVLKAQFQFFL